MACNSFGSPCTAIALTFTLTVSVLFSACAAAQPRAGGIQQRSLIDVSQSTASQTDTSSTVVQPAGDEQKPRSGFPLSRISRSKFSWPPTPLAGTSSDWNNLGCNPQRNGLSTVSGSAAATLLWENDGDFAIIADYPVIMGNRVFAIRMRDFITNSVADDLIAYDLETGEELWRIVLPFAGNTNEEWSAHILGVSEGRVYATRGGNGNSIEAPIYAYDSSDGSLIWTTTHQTGAGSADGAVFAPNGDLIVADFDDITRINSADGSVVWSVPRNCPTSGGCAAAINSNGVFVSEPAAGGNVVSKFDLNSGTFLYQSAVLIGLTSQNAPFASSDGTTIFFARSQNNETTDFLYALQDTGSALVTKWSRAVRWTVYHVHGIGPDGSLYTFLPGNEFVRLDPDTGQILNSAGVLSPIGQVLAAKTAVGNDGIVYVSNGWSNTPETDGRIWAFSADLQTNLFTLTLDRQNSGGPVLGPNGTLIVADRVSVRAYRDSSAITITPDSITTFRGELIYGTIDDVRLSDDLYLKYNPGLTIDSTEAPVWLIFDGISTDTSPDSLQLRVESQAGTTGLTLTVEAWNWTDSEYEIVAVSLATYNYDSVISADLSATISDYVHPKTGEVRARVGWRKTGLTFNFPWEVRLDQLVWQAE